MSEFVYTSILEIKGNFQNNMDANEVCFQINGLSSWYVYHVYLYRTEYSVKNENS